MAYHLNWAGAVDLKIPWHEDQARERNEMRYVCVICDSLQFMCIVDLWIGGMELWCMKID